MTRLPYAQLKSDGKIGVKIGFEKLMENINKISPIPIGPNITTPMWDQVKNLPGMSASKDIGEEMKKTYSVTKDKIASSMKIHELALLALEEYLIQQAMAARLKADEKRESLEGEFNSYKATHSSSHEDDSSMEEKEAIKQIEAWFKELKALTNEQKELQEKLTYLTDETIGDEPLEDILKRTKGERDLAQVQLDSVFSAEQILLAYIAKQQRQPSTEETSQIRECQHTKTRCEKILDDSHKIINAIEQNLTRKAILARLDAIAQRKDDLNEKVTAAFSKLSQKMQESLGQVHQHLEKAQENVNEVTQAFTAKAPAYKR